MDATLLPVNKSGCAYGRLVVEIVGVAEIADLLGVSKQRVHQLSVTDGFPAPLAQLQAGTFWRHQDILDWIAATGRTHRARRPAADEEG